LYPSLTESFGLPLLEAAKAGCKIIASDMPYVYEIVDPIEVFNPKDSISISKAIQNVSKNKNYITTPLKITNQINEILNLILC
jgi:glycosyltransferase involved in cell wall biosynthesis